MKTFAKIAMVMSVVSLFFTFAFARVASAQGIQGAVGTDDPTDQGNFQIVSCNPTYNPATGKLDNDCDYQQLVATATRIVKYILFIIIPIVGAMILWTGFKYMTAGGDANAVADAKRMLKPIAIGVFLIFAAWLIVYTILDKLLAPSIGEIQKSSIIGK
ncbi:MAG TPA: pilin [Candidatus Paceibacterota bacterium]|jgi:hypothetical protein|nr:pilin [Candidatus Paceibacterota bacterium]